MFGNSKTAEIKLPLESSMTERFPSLVPSDSHVQVSELNLEWPRGTPWVRALNEWSSVVTVDAFRLRALSIETFDIRFYSGIIHGASCDSAAREHAIPGLRGRTSQVRMA